MVGKNNYLDSDMTQTLGLSDKDIKYDKYVKGSNEKK